MKRIILALILLISILFSDEKKYIDGIIFNGNISLSDNELHSILKLKKPKLFRRSEFNRKMYTRDLQNLVGYYKSKGFLDANIIGVFKKISENYIGLWEIAGEVNSAETVSHVWVGKIHP